MAVDIPKGGFSCVLMDPPWDYANWSQKKHGAAKAHYDGMPYEQLAGIPVRTWMSDDSVLLLWATWPKLRDAIALVAEWELEYVTGFPWLKTVPSTGEIRRGVGFWVQQASEMLLVARRKVTAKTRGVMRDNPQIGLLIEQPPVFYAPIRGHSQKPLELYDWAEARWPTPRLELFATATREGWTQWGHSLGYDIGAHGVSEMSLKEHRNRAEFLNGDLSSAPVAVVDLSDILSEF
jgi:N6-adenosine-specific RNA methylase IME4